MNSEIVPFKSHHNILSNFYMCNISIFGENFKSAKHAYQWRKAIDANEASLATQIKRAIHAGKAKSLSKTISEEFCRQWETSNIDVMQEIITAKAQQVPEFRQSLMDSGESYLAEATFDKYWASGLSVEDTAKVNPKYFPGRNKLGLLLKDIRSKLVDNSGLAHLEAEGFSNEDIDPQVEDNEISHTELDHGSDDTHLMPDKQESRRAKDTITSAPKTRCSLEEGANDKPAEMIKNQTEKILPEPLLQDVVSAQT